MPMMRGRLMPALGRYALPTMSEAALPASVPHAELKVHASPVASPEVAIELGAVVPLGRCDPGAHESHNRHEGHRDQVLHEH